MLAQLAILQGGIAETRYAWQLQGKLMLVSALWTVTPRVATRQVSRCLSSCWQPRSSFEIFT